MNCDVFKIDTVKFKLRGNYVDQVLNSDIQNKIESYSKVNDSEFYSVNAKLGNLQVKATEYNFYLFGSLSNFMKAPVTHSNISHFFELINDNLNVDIQNAKLMRFDVCTDINTKISIQNIQASHLNLMRFSRNSYINTLYYNTSKNKGRGTALKLYRKDKNVIRYELTAYNNSKYCIEHSSLIERHFLRICEVMTKYYESIKKVNTMKLEPITKFSDIERNAIRMLFNENSDAIERLISLIDNNSHGYKMKARILSHIVSDNSTNLFELINENLVNTQKM